MYCWSRLLAHPPLLPVYARAGLKLLAPSLSTLSLLGRVTCERNFDAPVAPPHRDRIGGESAATANVVDDFVRACASSDVGKIRSAPTALAI